METYVKHVTGGLVLLAALISHSRAVPPQEWVDYPLVPKETIHFYPSEDELKMIVILRYTIIQRFCEDFNDHDHWIVPNYPNVPTKTGEYCVRSDVSGFMNAVKMYHTRDNYAEHFPDKPGEEYYEIGGCCYYNRTTSYFYAIGWFDHTRKPDTGRLNSSPMTNMATFLNVQYGCSKTINIPVYDPDGDVLRCSLFNMSTLFTENNLTPYSNVEIDKTTCTLTFGATNMPLSIDPEYFMIRIMVKDFFESTSSKPMSYISMYFTAIVYTGNTSCDDIPRFIQPTPDDGTRITFSDYEPLVINISVASTKQLYGIDITVDVDIYTDQTTSVVIDEGYITTRSFEWIYPDSKDGDVFIMCVSATEMSTNNTADIRCFYFIRFILEETLFPYGPSYGDNVLNNTDDSCSSAIIAKERIPVFETIHTYVYVCENGIVSFDRPFTSPAPNNDLDNTEGQTIVAPFFADVDIRKSGHVFYQMYNLLEETQERNSSVDDMIWEITSTLALFDHLDSFDPTFVLISTWYKVQPLRTSLTYEEATFQLVLVTDGENTYVVYLYGKMAWHDVLGLPDVWIGYRAGESYHETNVNSFTKQALRMNLNAETLGSKGMLIYKLTLPKFSKPNYDVRCLKWYNKYKDERYTNVNTALSLPECPCDIDSLLLNPWFESPQQSPNNKAIVCSDIFPTFLYSPHGKSCCYNTTTNLWISNRTHAGSFVKYHQRTHARDHKEQDKDPKYDCCFKSNLCHLFYELRPTGGCQKTQRFQLGTTWGDPHFKTLDNMTFTFNGLGEFVLINIEATFTVQARTERALKENGNFSDATIFTAFAASDYKNASLHVELNTNRKGINIYVNKIDVTRQYNKAHANYGQYRFDSDEENIVVTSDKPEEMTAFFPSCGIALNISIGVDMLTLSSLVPKFYETKTSGLYGNFDGEPNNDFQTPDGEVKSPGMTEEDIHTYGMLWSVNPATSVFYYPDRKGNQDFQFPHFMPKFLNNVSGEKRKQAEEKCFNSIECIFDLVLTDNEAVANNTLNAKNRSLEVSNEIRKNVPNLSGCGKQYVTLGDTVTCSVEFVDDVDLTFTFIDNNAGAYYNSSDNTIVYVQSTTDPAIISLTAENKDNKKAPPIVVEVLLCTGCNNHGTCRKDIIRNDDRNTDVFQYAKCDCEPEYEGVDCEKNFDGCASKPCSLKRECNDLSPEEHKQQSRAYTCGPCPLGYVDDGTKCIDIDECSQGKDFCEQVCNNVEGSFSCSCKTGYRVDPTDSQLCKDVNECDEALDDCEQVCQNTEGNYSCQCFNGFVEENGACILDMDVCASSALDCGATAGCTLDDSTGRPVCFCRRGYELTENGTACRDTDECITHCSQSCENSPGSFTCRCYSGYHLTLDNYCKECEYPFWGENCENTCKCVGQGASTCSPIRGCVCKPGWQGETCNDDVDKCVASPGICGDVRKVCLNTGGLYVCQCLEGYQLTHDDSCTDIDECSDPTLNDCDQICINSEGGYSCDCNEGFTKTGVTQCLDIDECGTKQSGCQQTCENFPGFYNCYCYFGFVLNNDRLTCTKVSNPCEFYSNLTCSHICVVRGEQAECMCDIGYILEDDGETCTDIDECAADDLNVCTEDAVCENTEGSYTCKCPIGRKLENDGRTCRQCDKFHYGVNCREKCSCLHGTCDNIRGCVCASGWSGKMCDKDINECLTSDQLCQKENTVCLNLPGNYSCRCETGFQNVNDVCQDINECEDIRLQDCSQNCVNIPGGYTCSCERGFLVNGHTCEDIDECSGFHDCDQDCENTAGSYKCSCVSGFLLNKDGKSCRVTTTCQERISSDCEDQNATCYVESGGELCRCNKGFIMTEEGCKDVEECAQAESPCDHDCVEMKGGYRCECRTGFFLNADMRTCTVCQRGTFGDNCDQVCSCNTSNTEVCDQKYGTCTCKTGWTGIMCEDDINECADDVSPCHENAHCVNQGGSYSCRCETGYIPTEDGICEVCASWWYGENCGSECECDIENSASCSNVDGTCLCFEGWDGPDCYVDKDECSFGVCDEIENSYCLNTPGSYVCKCKDGFTYENGLCKDDDECILNEGVCPYICNNTQSGYECICAHGYFGDGYVCTECPDRWYGFNCSEECQCDTDHVDDTMGRVCDAHSGTCYCTEFWMGPFCDVDVDECEDRQTCESDKQTGCHNQQGGYECDCFKGYTRDDNDVCVQDPKEPDNNQNDEEGMTSVKLVIKLEVEIRESVDFRVAKTFTAYATDLTATILQFFKEQLGNGINTIIRITALRRGSLVAEYDLIYEDTIDVAAREQIFTAVSLLRKGASLDFRNQTVTAVDETFTDACDMYVTIFGKCGETQACVEGEDGPVCRDKDKDILVDASAEDNLGNGTFVSYCELTATSVHVDKWTLVIILSASFVVLFVLLIVVGYCIKRRRNDLRESGPHSHSVPEDLESTTHTYDNRRPRLTDGFDNNSSFDPPETRNCVTWQTFFWKEENSANRAPLQIPRAAIGQHRTTTGQAVRFTESTKKTKQA